jgi:hypothetical protein
MSSKLIASDIKNFNDFRAYISKYGFSINNFYDVQFLIGNTGSSFFNSVFTRSINSNSNSDQYIRELMRLYADECSIPGYAISTGDFRITNSPNMKYGYGIVNNELTISFISDADSEIRQTFDAWGNYIYGGISSNTNAPIKNALNINSVNDLGRTRYKDDYVLDIVIVKLERYRSSKRNSGSLTDPLTGEFKGVPLSRLFPGTDPSQLTDTKSLFGEAKQVYSVRLQNAFPTTISAIPLNSGASQLVKLQVTFEYDMAVPASQTGGTVDSGGTWATLAK